MEPTSTLKMPEQDLGPGTREKLATILSTAKTLVVEQDPTQILYYVVQQAADAVGADRCSLFLQRPGRNELYTCYAMGETEPIEIALDRGLAGDVARNLRGICVQDARSDPRFDPSVDARTGYVTRSVLAVPICGSNGTLVGVLEAINKLHGHFTLLDSETLEGLAALLGAIFDRARERHEVAEAYRQLHHREQQIRLLHCFERALADHSTPEQCMPLALEFVRQSLSAEGASVLLGKNAGSQLEFCWVTSEQSGKLTGVTLEQGEGIAWEVFQSGEARIVKSARSHPGFSGRVQQLAGMQTVDMIAVPLVSEERTEGVLEIVNSARGGFTEEDLVMARILGDIVGQSLHRMRQLEQQRQAERLTTIGKMASSIIHDLKNPLSILLGYSSMLHEETPGSKEEVAQIGSVLVRQTERCQRLIRDLLDFCAGRQNLVVEPLELRGFLERLRKDLEEDLARSSVKLEIESAAGGSFRGDPHKLERVFSNLASNSRAVMPDGGTFRIACSEDGDCFEFRVSDTGPGIPKQVADRLFEPFVTFGKKEGTGLGLSIIKGIVEAHGGTVRVEPAQGALFVIRLPRAG